MQQQSGVYVASLAAPVDDRCPSLTPPRLLQDATCVPGYFGSGAIACLMDSASAHHSDQHKHTSE